MEAAQNKKKLIQLMESKEQHNIDLGVYQWLAQGYSVFELVRVFTDNYWYNLAGDMEPFKLYIGNFYFIATFSSRFSNSSTCNIFYELELGVDCLPKPLRVIHQKDLGEHVKINLILLFNHIKKTIIA